MSIRFYDISRSTVEGALEIPCGSYIVSVALNNAARQILVFFGGDAVAGPFRPTAEGLEEALRWCRRFPMGGSR